MELVYYDEDYKFISKPMPVFIHEEQDKSVNTNNLSSDKINVTKLYQYELFSNLNEKISSNIKRYMILFIIILLLILFIVVIN